MKRLMKGGTWIFSVFLFCLAMVFSAGSAGASALSGVTAYIDWDTLGIDMGNPSATLNWDYEEWTAWAYASNDRGEEVDNKLIDYDYADASVTDAEAEADGTSDRKKSYSQVDIPGYDNEALAHSTLWYYAEFWISGGDSLVTFEVDYYLEMDTTTGGVGDWAYGKGNAGIEIDNFVTYEYLGDSDDILGEAQNGSIFLDDREGRLEVSAFFYEDDWGAFGMEVRSWAEAETAIPEPSTMLLLGSGLIGLAGLRRKFRKV